MVTCWPQLWTVIGKSLVALAPVPAASSPPQALVTAHRRRRPRRRSSGCHASLSPSRSCFRALGSHPTITSQRSATSAGSGTRLRWLETVSAQTTISQTSPSGALPLHTDAANVFIDIHDRRSRLRDPDIDHILILCDTPAPTGGESMVCDGYRLVERIRDHDRELYKFLTTVDVETGSGDRETARVARMVEWTRGGRLVVRSDPWCRPRPRDPLADEHERLLRRYADLLATVAAHAPTTRLRPGEILVLDNYRCPHGVGNHAGFRRVHVLRCKSADAH